MVILGRAEREGRPVSFWQFTRYGLIVTAITIKLEMPYLWLRYFVLLRAMTSNVVRQAVQVL